MIIGTSNIDIGNNIDNSGRVSKILPHLSIGGDIIITKGIHWQVPKEYFEYMPKEFMKIKKAFIHMVNNPITFVRKTDPLKIESLLYHFKKTINSEYEIIYGVGTTKSADNQLFEKRANIYGTSVGFGGGLDSDFFSYQSGNDDKNALTYMKPDLGVVSWSPSFSFYSGHDLEYNTSKNISYIFYRDFIDTFGIDNITYIGYYYMANLELFS